MASAGIDCLIVYSYHSALTAYWTGYAARRSLTNACLLVLSDSGEGLHLTRLPIHVATAEQASQDIEHRCVAPSPDAVGSPQDMAGAAASWLARRGASPRVAFAAYPPEAGILLPLSKELGYEPTDVTRDVAELIGQRSVWQLDRIRNAAAIARQAFAKGVGAAAIGRRPREVSLAAESVLGDHGVERWKCFAGATDDRGRSLLGADDRPLASGDMLFFEVIPEVEEFCPEIVANVFIDRVKPSWRELDEHMEKCLDRALGEISPSATFAQVHERMMADIASHPRAATGDVYRLGHGTGLDNLEVPEYIDAADQRAIGENRILSIHPNTAVPGLGTMIRGGTMIVHDGKCEPLFEFPAGPILAG
jgi:Xaa-Pro aminopeptidase